MVRHALSNTASLNVNKQLYCTDCNDSFLRECAKQYCLDMVQQQGADLGDRMAHCTYNGLQQYDTVMIIGTDCPQIDSLYCQNALRQSRDNDTVIGPAQDGGYVMITLHRFDARIFQTIDWGSGRVLEQTRRQLRSLAWRWSEMHTLNDIDLPADLALAEKYLSPNRSTDRL